jgi:mannose/fructose/N-acetylgalactosamine-specific phosphotransferase system component IID
MAQRSAASTAIVEILVEGVSVGIMVLLAGISDNVSNVMLILIVGFWLVYLIVGSDVLTSVFGAYLQLAQNPSNKPGVGTSTTGNLMYTPGNPADI